MLVPKIEKSIGLEIYATSSSGIGGTIRENIEDFVVNEVLVDGSKAETYTPVEDEKRGALGATLTTNRYLLCTLTKRNWDTFIAIKNIAHQLGISPAQIHTAGIKDAKAVTSQFITVEGVSIEDAKNTNIKDISIRPIGYLRNKLSAYYLLGNNFHIRIATMNLPKSAIRNRITKTIEELKTLGGIPNFFGHQRFGTTRPITHLVGKAIVRGNIKKAAMLLLAKPSPHEHPSSRQARQELQKTQDFSRALQNFPRQLRFERMMLESLVENPDDFIGAFRRLPIKLRELLIQAYQSYLFNRFLSRRIKNGSSLNLAEVGDYVVNVERSGLPTQALHSNVSFGTLEQANSFIKTGKQRLAIALPGFKQPLSQGAQGEIEKDILEEEGVLPGNFKINEMPEMSARGELRAIATPLRDFSLGKISNEGTNKKKSSAEVSFTLYRSSYATVVLRELMKPRNPLKARF